MPLLCGEIFPLRAMQRAPCGIVLHTCSIWPGIQSIPSSSTLDERSWHELQASSEQARGHLAFNSLNMKGTSERGKSNYNHTHPWEISSREEVRLLFRDTPSNTHTYQTESPGTVGGLRARSGGQTRLWSRGECVFRKLSHTRCLLTLGPSHYTHLLHRTSPTRNADRHPRRESSPLTRTIPAQRAEVRGERRV